MTEATIFAAVDFDKLDSKTRAMATSILPLMGEEGCDVDLWELARYSVDEVKGSVREQMTARVTDSTTWLEEVTCRLALKTLDGIDWGAVYQNIQFQHQELTKAVVTAYHGLSGAAREAILSADSLLDALVDVPGGHFVNNDCGNRTEGDVDWFGLFGLLKGKTE